MTQLKSDKVYYGCIIHQCIPLVPELAWGISFEFMHFIHHLNFCHTCFQLVVIQHSHWKWPFTSGIYLLKMMIFHGWPFPDQRCKGRQRPGEWIPRQRGTGTRGGTRLPAAEQTFFWARKGHPMSRKNLGVGLTLWWTNIAIENGHL